MPAMTAHQYDECVQHNLAADRAPNHGRGPSPPAPGRSLAGGAARGAYLMDTSIFRFALGQRVTWLQTQRRVWIIHVRMLLDDAQGTSVQYGIRPEDRPDVRHEVWVREAELEPSPCTPQKGTSHSPGLSGKSMSCR